MARKIAAGPWQGAAAGEVGKHPSARPVAMEEVQRPRRRRTAPLWSDEAIEWLRELSRRLRAERAAA